MLNHLNSSVSIVNLTSMKVTNLDIGKTRAIIAQSQARFLFAFNGQLRLGGLLKVGNY